MSRVFVVYRRKPANQGVGNAGDRKVEAAENCGYLHRAGFESLLHRSVVCKKKRVCEERVCEDFTLSDYSNENVMENMHVTCSTFSFGRFEVSKTD